MIRSITRPTSLVNSKVSLGFSTVELKKSRDGRDEETTSGDSPKLARCLAIEAGTKAEALAADAITNRAAWLNFIFY